MIGTSKYYFIFLHYRNGILVINYFINYYYIHYFIILIILIYINFPWFITNYIRYKLPIVVDTARSRSPQHFSFIIYQNNIGMLQRYNNFVSNKLRILDTRFLKMTWHLQLSLSNARQPSSVIWYRITRQLMRGHCEPDPGQIYVVSLRRITNQTCLI